MKRARIIVYIALIVLSCSTLAQVKINARNPGGILSNPVVQKDLKLSEKQLAVIKEVQDDLRNLLIGVFSGRGVTGTSEEIQSSVDAESIRFEARIFEMLSPVQLQRLKELDLQLGGPDTILNSVYAEEMKLTADQKLKIKSIQRQYREAMSDLQRGGIQYGDEQAMQELTKKGEQIRSRALNSVFELLNSEQKCAYTKMKGEPVKV